MSFKDQSVQPVEVVVGGPLPRAGYVQPVEIIGGGGGMPGYTWELVGSGQVAMPSGTSVDVINDPDPVTNELYIASVSPADAAVTDKSISQGNVGAAPPANAIFYSLISASAGVVSLRIRSNAGTPVVLNYALWKGTP